MSEITVAQMKNDSKEFSNINKETTIHKSEIDEIIQQMNEELNNKITEQNQKVESLETILKEIAAENKANKEKEKNREKIVVEAYRQSKDTAKNVKTVKKINK